MGEQDMKRTIKSSITNSYIHNRDPNDVMFREVEKGAFIVTLDRYAIVPLEKYFDPQVQENVRRQQKRAEQPEEG